MALQRLAMTNDLEQMFRTTLAGKSVVFHIQWNELDAHWYMEMDVEGVTVIVGRRMGVETDLIYDQVALPGELFVLPLITDDHAEMGRTGWDVTHGLVYRGAD